MTEYKKVEDQIVMYSVIALRRRNGPPESRRDRYLKFGRWQASGSEKAHSSQKGRDKWAVSFLLQRIKLVTAYKLIEHVARDLLYRRVTTAS
jgi:hypothetical protein